MPITDKTKGLESDVLCWLRPVRLTSSLLILLDLTQTVLT